MTLKQQRKPNEADLDEIEAVTGLALTESFKHIYMMHSGSKTEDFGPHIQVLYPDGTDSEENLQAFLTVHDIREQWPHVGYLEQFADHFDLDENFVEPEFLVPIASVYDGGIYMAVGGRHVDKFFLADNGDFGIACLASGVDDFLKLVDLTN
ncbi:MAG: hypothetical protein GY768_27670 [Planctomycetaceae bacterium]|nr:hypothetical protein [Planctomycetaceae bacterium]